MKRYQEFLIDVLIKTYQIIFAAMVISPISSKEINVTHLSAGAVVCIVALVWSGMISYLKGE